MKSFLNLFFNLILKSIKDIKLLKQKKKDIKKNKYCIEPPI